MDTETECAATGGRRRATCIHTSIYVRLTITNYVSLFLNAITCPTVSMKSIIVPDSFPSFLHPETSPQQGMHMERDGENLLQLVFTFAFRCLVHLTFKNNGR